MFIGVCVVQSWLLGVYVCALTCVASLTFQVTRDGGFGSPCNITVINPTDAMHNPLPATAAAAAFAFPASVRQSTGSFGLATGVNDTFAFIRTWLAEVT